MKPIPPAPSTSEDWEVWKRLEITDHPRWLETLDLIEGADRRDADLMLQAQLAPGRRMFDCYGEDMIPGWARGLPRGWTP